VRTALTGQLAHKGHQVRTALTGQLAHKGHQVKMRPAKTALRFFRHLILKITPKKTLTASRLPMWLCS
jgi:hypothetical protein